MMTKKQTLLSVKQAASLVGLSPCQLRVLIRNDLLKAEMIGTEYLIEQSAIDHLVQRRRLKESAHQKKKRGI